MLGLDTIILKRVTKWVEAGKTDAEIIQRAKTFMWSVLAIHGLLAIIAGWWLYQNIKAEKRNTLNLVIPTVVFLIALIIPIGTEKGEELTNVMSSGLFALASIICNIISVVVWFTKKSAEEVENK